MVKKLMKYELTYYFRSLGLFLPIFFVVGIMTRILLCFDSNDLIYSVISAMSTLLLGVSSVGLMLFASIIGIVRFYKNMYSAEGYLTFTLPVSNRTHIFVKLFAAVINQVLCFLATIAVVCIALSGKNLYLFLSEMEFLVSYFNTAELIVLFIEFAIMLPLSLATGMLLYYACITIGQTAKKNRILKAVGAYFVYYIATQVISTAFIITYTVLGLYGALDGIMEWVSANLSSTILIAFGVSIVLNTIMAVAFWIVTEKIMTKRLNLE